MSNAFFRHFRPVFFDKVSMTLKSASRGGISFLFKPVDQGVYDYWIYVCPEDAAFSSSAAVHKLSIVANQGTKPWGQILKNDNPILETAIKSLISEPSPLPTTVGQLALRFVMNNAKETHKLQQFASAISLNRENVYANECQDR